jgi:hypothetical protein
MLDKNLDQKDMHRLGEVLLESINRQYQGLIQDADNCWQMSQDISLFQQVSCIVAGLQNGRTLIRNEFPTVEVKNGEN